MTIEVLTNFPLRQILHKPEASGRILKWTIELSQFNIRYKPRTMIKGQTLAELVARFTQGEENNGDLDQDSQKLNLPTWSLYVDGSSNEEGQVLG